MRLLPMHLVMSGSCLCMGQEEALELGVGKLKLLKRTITFCYWINFNIICRFSDTYFTIHIQEAFLSLVVTPEKFA